MTLPVLTFPLTSSPSSLCCLCASTDFLQVSLKGRAEQSSRFRHLALSWKTNLKTCIFRELYMIPGTTYSAVNFRGGKVSEVTFENVHPKLYPVLCWKCRIPFFYRTFVLTPLTTIFVFSPVLCCAWCLIAVHYWPCFNFWRRCKVLFFFQSYCSNGSSRYLTHPRAALHIERKSFRL